MRKIQRNVPSAQKTNPASLENTRDPQEYKAATVKAYNDRYKSMWSIDAAKAKLISVRQNSFKKWLATVVLGEDIFDSEGNYVTTHQRSAEITREELNRGVLTVTRMPGETPFETWHKVEAAAGLEENELVAQLLLKDDARSAVYEVSPMSLNYYGTLRVKFIPAAGK